MALYHWWIRHYHAYAESHRDRFPRTLLRRGSPWPGQCER